jgi:hypothetical protein
MAAVEGGEMSCSCNGWGVQDKQSNWVSPCGPNCAATKRRPLRELYNSYATPVTDEEAALLDKLR